MCDEGGAAFLPKYNDKTKQNERSGMPDRHERTDTKRKKGPFGVEPKAVALLAAGAEDSTRLPSAAATVVIILRARRRWRLTKIFAFLFTPRKFPAQWHSPFFFPLLFYNSYFVLYKNVHFF